jgi:hypothetical protein
MATCRRFARYAAIIPMLAASNVAVAQTGSAHLRAGFELIYDCERPISAHNFPVHAQLTAVLNTDRSATADLEIAAVLSTTVHFEAHLGGGPRPAPGGTTTQLHVMSRDRLQAKWDLPNNQFILDIVASGRSCSVKLSNRLKPGKREYSLLNGDNYYYCSKERLLKTSCEAE